MLAVIVSDGPVCVCVFVRCIVHHQIRKECACVAYYFTTSDAGVRFKSACVCCAEMAGMKRRDGVRYKESRGDVPGGGVGGGGVGAVADGARRQRRSGWLRRNPGRLGEEVGCLNRD